MVRFDEDGGAELDDLRRIGPGVYGCRPATDVRIAFVDFDLEGYPGVECVLREMVSCG